MKRRRIFVAGIVAGCLWILAMIAIGSVLSYLGEPISNSRTEAGDAEDGWVSLARFWFAALLMVGWLPAFGLFMWSAQPGGSDDA